MMDDSLDSSILDSPSHAAVSDEMETSDRSTVMKLPSQNGVIALMDHPSTLTVYNYVSIQVLSGTISVLGYEVTPAENPPIEVFSSEKTGLIEIKTKTYDDIWKKTGSSADLEQLIQNITQNKRKTSLVLDKLGTHTVLVFIKRCVYPINFQFVELYFPELFDFLSKENKMDDVHVKNCAPIQFDQNVEKLVSDISKCFRNSKLTEIDIPCVMVCGNKNTGKSTLIRYLMNSFISEYEVAYFLDTDPGQTEFTPPGVVSLTKVVKPIFGPSFCHQRKPLSMIFTGNLTATSPDEYAKSVDTLMDLYNRKYKNGPLFINTMGWMEGLGLDCLKSIIPATKPTMLIEIVTEEHSSMFDYREYVSSNCLYYQISCPFKQKTNWFSAKDYREFALLSYLGMPKCQCPFMGPVPITDVRPYCVSWDDIAVFQCNQDIQPYRLIEAISLSIVALCAVPESNIVESSIRGFSNTIKDELMNTCLGFGLVRAIDETKHILYIVTPLRSEELERVNAIIRGQVMVPDVLILKQKFYGQKLPYTNVRKVEAATTDVEMHDASMVSNPEVYPTSFSMSKEIRKKNIV